LAIRTKPGQVARVYFPVASVAITRQSVVTAPSCGNPE
jgi:hypothetical protein